MKRLAVAGLAIAALPHDSVAPELERRKLSVVPMRGWPLRRTLAVVYHRHKYLSNALIAFLDELKCRVSVA